MSTSAPHAHDASRAERIMLHVCLALVPATGLGIYLFGWPALLLWLVTCAAAVATEAICLWLMDRPLRSLRDNSALLTGWLLAISLPPWAPWWIGAGGAAFAIAIGKQLYGGLGQNVFNPAMLARVALLISFPVQMTTWVDIIPLGSPEAPGLITSLKIVFTAAAPPDAVTGATLLGQTKAAYTGPLMGEQSSVAELLRAQFDPLRALLGQTRGSLGETSELLVLLGGLWLLYRRIISWHIPVALLGSTALLAGVFHGVDPERYADPVFHLSSGGIALGAFFIATDYVTSPSTATGKLLFGAGCGAVLYTIRTWGGFPEAVGFAVLFMNALTPLIDRLARPRAYGRNRRGEPRRYPSLAASGTDTEKRAE